MPLTWVPKSIGNPNPKITSIDERSSSNSPKFNPDYDKKKKKKKRRNRNRKFNNKLKPNWLDLPEDMWFLIVSKLGTIDIIENVQKVCKLFRKICTQPSVFRIVNMVLPDGEVYLEYDVNVMTRYAIDRSNGGLIDIYLEDYCDDRILMYIVESSKNLKHLRIGRCIHISGEGLVEAVLGLPMLEEVEIVTSGFSDDIYEALGHSCPSLKSFSLNYVFESRDIHDIWVAKIAKNMPNLQRLQLIGSLMSNEGLKAILDGCVFLESLDLRACVNIDLSGDLGIRCNKIKHLLRPNDSTAYYSHEAIVDEDYYFDEDYFEETYSHFDDFTSDFNFGGLGFRDYDDYTADYYWGRTLP